MPSELRIIALSAAIQGYPSRVARVPVSGNQSTHAEVLDQVDLAVIATDAAGIVTVWNARAEKVYGWSAEEAIGRPVNDLVVTADDKTLAAEIMDSVRAGQPWQGSFRVARRDGSVFTAFVKDMPMLDEAGNLVGVVGVSIELSDPHLASAVRAVASADGDGRMPRRG